VTLDEELGMVVAGAHNQKIHIYDLAGDRLEGEVEVSLGEGPINSVRISHLPGHEKETFVACYSSTIARVARNGEVTGKIHVHEGAVKALRLHPTKPVGVSCGADGLLLSWSYEGEILQRFLGHTAIINDVDLSPSGDKVASVSRDFTLKVYDLDSGRPLHSFALGQRSLKSVCFVDEDTVVVGDYWGSLIKVELSAGRVSRSWVAENGISAVARCGSNVAATSYDGAVYLVNPSDMSVIRDLRAMQQRLLERVA
jgi:WD40 repeat protein